jgi:ketosteroid isomerase-like protein
MSEENRRVVEAALQAWTKSGLDAFANYWTDDIEWRAIGGKWQGKDAGLAYLGAWYELFDDFTVEPIDLIDAGGERFIIHLRYRGRAPRGGMQVPPEYCAALIDVRDGKIVHAVEYATPEEALEAAGLRE